MDVREIVATELQTAGANKTTLALWDEIAATYEQSTPDGVRELLSEKVKAAKKRATKEAKEMTDVAGTVAKPKKKGRK